MITFFSASEIGLKVKISYVTLSHAAFTCSKLTVETLEQGVKYANGVVLASLLLTLNIRLTLF